MKKKQKPTQLRHVFNFVLLLAVLPIWFYAAYLESIYRNGLYVLFAFCLLVMFMILHHIVRQLFIETESTLKDFLTFIVKVIWDVASP